MALSFSSFRTNPDRPSGAQPVWLRRLLYGMILLLAILGLGADILEVYRPSDSADLLVSLFSLGYEGNIPTWYSSSLLFWCGLELMGIASTFQKTRAAWRWHWSLLCLLFFYISLDEAVGFHEHFGGWVEQGGLLYFDWILPAALFLIMVGAFYLPFLRALPKEIRKRFLLAGAVYVGGALLMEMPLGWWTSKFGADNLGYAIIDEIEEVMEMVGAILFLSALWDSPYRQSIGGRMPHETD